jgi:hypothetical protein
VFPVTEIELVFLQAEQKLLDDNATEQTRARPQKTQLLNFKVETYFL